MRSHDDLREGEERELSVVLAGGGTAGHINPMLAIARALLELEPGTRVLAVGTASGMEARIVPEAGFELATIDKVPFPRRPGPALFGFPGAFRAAVRQAGEILDAAAADVAVGVGGYVCTPLYLAARKRGIPVVVHEANTRPGLANRVGARSAAFVGKAFASTRLRHAEWVGMPMRREVSQLDRAAARQEARHALGLDPDLPTLVVTGGSSGALSVNRAVAEAVPAFAAAGVQVLHLTGRGKQLFDGEGVLLAAPGYAQREYVDGMELVYAAADLLLCRSGAGTVCEVAAVGLPAVFVPLPIGNGEQALNAEGLVQAGAALLVRDAELTTTWLQSEVLPLVKDSAALAEMAEKASGLGIRDADQTMARRVLEAGRP